MKLRLSCFLISMFVLTSTVTAPIAYAEWQGCLDDKAFNNLLEAYQIDPGTLAKNPEALKNISSAQLDTIVKTLGTTHFTYLYPVEIKCDKFPAFSGKKLDRLSIMAVRGNKLIPIPFQFDEYDTTGLIYIKKVSPYDPEGVPGKMDDSDRLAFMFRDAGRGRYNGDRMQSVKGKILSEIRLDTPGHCPRYVYLVEGNGERSDVDYVTTDLDNGIIETTLFKIVFNPKNFTEIREVSPKAGPHYGQNAVDNLYVKMSTGVLMDQIRFSMNSMDNINVIPLGVKDGPVRAAVLFQGRLWYFRLPTIFKEYLNVNFYEQAFNIPSRFTLDALDVAKYFVDFIKRPYVEVSLDLHGLQGARFTFDNVYDPENPRYAVVDNHVSDFERKIAQTRLPGRWLYFDSNQGWTFFFSNQMHVEPNGFIGRYLDGMHIEFIYEDNLISTKEYEKYPGAEPRLGVIGEGIPIQAMNLFSAIRAIDWSEIKCLGDLFLEMHRVGKMGKLKAFDKITNQIVADLKAQGLVKEKEDLVQMFLVDMKEIKFQGVDQEKFTEMVSETMRTEINDEMNNIDHFRMLDRLLKVSKREGVDLTTLQYVRMDSTLWFPDAIDGGDPVKFHEQVEHPPEPTIIQYGAAQCSGGL